jgi:hypothetical protein
MVLTWTPLEEVFPNVLGGFIVAGIGMVVGSLLPTRANARFRQMKERREKFEAKQAALAAA